MFISIKPKNPYFASRRGLEVKPLGVIHSDHVALPAVLPKVHHRPEPLYVPTEVHTLSVDGLARIPGLMQALTNAISFQDLPLLTPPCINIQDSRVTYVQTLKESQGERGEGATHERFGG